MEGVPFQPLAVEDTLAPPVAVKTMRLGVMDPVLPPTVVGLMESVAVGVVLQPGPQLGDLLISG